jgi:hypothetical protein
MRWPLLARLPDPRGFNTLLLPHPATSATVPHATTGSPRCRARKPAKQVKGEEGMGRQRRRLRSSLHIADSSAWRHESHYSYGLADALIQAYAAVQGGQQSPDRYLAAYAALVPYRDRPLCAPQRLHLEYALALAYAGEEAVPQALECLAQAAEIAEKLDDAAAQAEIGYLAGALCHLVTRRADAYAVSADALACLDALRQDDEPADALFELDLTLRLAGHAWELGWFTTCLRHLEHAHALRAKWVPDAAQEAALLAWLDAQLARVRGRPSQAVQLATAAADLLLNLDQPLNAGRCHTVAAECGFELIEELRSPSTATRLPFDAAITFDQARLLSAGRASARRALELARVAQDSIGVGMAQLALRHGARLDGDAGEDGSGLAAVEAVAQIARWTGDVSLGGRVETARGDELAATGDGEAALNAYRRALRLLEEHDLRGLAFWPRMALHRTLGRENNP